MNEKNSITIPEEEIYTTLLDSLKESFPLLLIKYSTIYGKTWISPFASILADNEEKEQKPLPLIQIHLNSVIKKSSDPFVELGEYLLELDCRFDRSSPEFTPYRYSFLIQEWFSSDENLRAVFDRSILEEVCNKPLCSQNASGYPEAIYTIRLFRDRIK